MFFCLVIRSAVTRLAVIKLFDREKTHMNIVKLPDGVQLSAEFEMEDRSLQPLTLTLAAPLVAVVDISSGP